MAMGAVSVEAQAALCSFGTSSSEASLQTIMNQRISPSPSAITGCIDNTQDVHWTASQGAAATILIEVAGYASQNTFGVYDINNPNNRLQLFSGSATTNATRTITVTALGGGYEYVTRSSTGTILSSAVFQSMSFGYYLMTPQSSGQIYYSDVTLNTDNVDHLYSYQGNGGVFLNNLYTPKSLRGTAFDTNTHLLAWEDLYGGGDRDYQDMVLVTRNIAPVPLPGALLLFGSALLGVGWMRRKRSLPA
jgi:hypothetical protein